MAKVMAAIVAAVLFVITGCGVLVASGDPVTGGRMSLGQAINRLPVIGEHARDGYDRGAFRHWVDADKDGCDTRAEVLLAESRIDAVTGDGCMVVAGAWLSYYDAVSVTSAKALDVDHLVPLAEAWDSGAWEWNTAARRSYANDLTSPVTLVAVTAASNRSKGDKDLAQWLPPDTSAHCRYTAEWVTVKRAWGLSVDPGERDALLALATDCPGAVVVD